MPAVLIHLPGYDEDAPDSAPALVPRLDVPMTSKTATRFLYLAFGLFIVASMTYYVMQTIGGFKIMMRGPEHARIPFRVDDDLLTISHLESEAVSAGLKPGDRLVEARGAPYRGRPQQIALWGGSQNFVHTGAPLDVVVLRSDGSIHHATIHSVSGGPPVHSSLEWTIRTLVQALPLICLLIGYWVAAARIRDPNAWLLLFLFAAPTALSSPPDY